MRIGLLLNSNNKLSSYSEKFKEILIKNEIPHVIIDPNSYSLLEDLKGCSHLLFRHSQGDTDIKIYDAIFNIARQIHGMECLPDYETFWPYEDKIKEYYLLKGNNFPIIDSHIFWNFGPALAYLDEVQLPVVAKLPKGASSSNVVIVNSAQEGRKILKQVFSKGVKNEGLKSDSNLSSFHNTGLFSYGKRFIRALFINFDLIRDRSNYPEWQIQKDSILFQKYLPGNTSDTRITVIGGRAFAFRRMVRKNDFRASGSGNIDMEMDKIDRRCLEIAFSVSKKLKFSTMAYDFIFDEDNNPKINEISYCFVDKFVENCPGFWDEELTWHPGRNWPQYYQLVDFLKIDGLKPL